MIDILSEKVVSFTEATGHLPRRRKGKRPHVATVYRWAQKGCKGVRLETIQVGGTKCTSLEALQRFFEQLTQRDETPVPTTPKAGARSVSDAKRTLAEAGI